MGNVRKKYGCSYEESKDMLETKNSVAENKNVLDMFIKYTWQS